MKNAALGANITGNQDILGRGWMGTRIVPLDDDLPDEIVNNPDRYKEFIMIISEIYYGSGIGNQIWHYVVTRLIAERLGYKYGIMGKDRWKGQPLYAYRLW